MPKLVRKPAKRRPSADPNLRVHQMADHAARVQPAEPQPAPLDFQTQYKAHMKALGSKGGKIGGKNRIWAICSIQRKAPWDSKRLPRDGRRNALGRSARGNAMLVKLYGKTDPESERRYSPATCIGTIPTPITGHPDHISTSYVERQNWTVRRTMRRYTRLSNGFSRKIENHMAAVAINYFAYNFIKIHNASHVARDGRRRHAAPV